MFKKWLARLKAWALKTWHQLDNWQTLILFVIVCAVIYSPVWGGYVLYFLFHWKWAMWMATAVLAFWAAPFTPFFPICIAITLFIKKTWLDFLHWRHVRKMSRRQLKA